MKREEVTAGLGSRASLGPLIERSPRRPAWEEVVHSGPARRLPKSQQRIRPDTVTSVAALSLLGLLLALATTLLLFLTKRPLTVQGDTIALVRGIPAIGHCLGHAVLFRCNQYVAAHSALGHPVTPITLYPLIQTVPAVLMYASGLSQLDIREGLGWINFIAVIVVASVILRWSYRRGGLSLAVVAGLLLLPGMLLAYSVQTLGEPLAAVAFIAVVLAALRPDSVSRFLLPFAIIATISKETAAPFVVLYGFAAIMLSGARPATKRGALGRLLMGVATGVALDAGFNVFRYGSVLNRAYLNIPHTLDGAAVGANSLALLVSPNGGIFWFWPGVGISLIALILAAVRWPAWRAADLEPHHVRTGVVIALVAFVGYGVFLGMWSDPMGWYAWGPRLFIPGAAPLVVLALPLIGPRLRQVWLSVPVIMSMSIAAMVVLLPTIGIISDGFAFNKEMAMALATVRYRPECHDRTATADSLWESCQRTEEWRMVGMPLVDAVPTSFSAHRVYWVAVASAEAAILLSVGYSRLDQDRFRWRHRIDPRVHSVSEPA
jgi:hypothetical protein